MLLTATQIAEKINRPPTTVRDWGVKYKDYLPRKQKGRFFMYSELATEIFKRISELHSSGLTTEQVRETLDKESGRQQDGDIVSDNDPTTTESSLVVSQQFQATMSGFIKIFERQEKLLSVLIEQNELLKEKLGINEPTRSPRNNDKPKADKKPTPKPKMTTKQVKTNLAKAKTVKRKIKINPRGKNGRFTKKKKSFLARLFD